MDRMDMLSDLPDALLVKILSLLPTKEVVSTMLLSKRWQFLWMFVSRLEYNDDMYQDGRFLRFLYSSLLLHQAKVLESFSLKLGRNSRNIDLGVCVTPAVNRCVRELIIETDSSVTETTFILPRSLYNTGSRMLVTLKLQIAVLVDASETVSFPSLKTLSLLSMKYPGDDFLGKLLSDCPVLEDLFVVPKVVEAHLDVTYSHPQQLLASLTSLVQLSLCLATSMDTHFDGTIFSQLEQLKVCTCETEWLDLLMRLLKAAPKLMFIVLELSNSHGIRTEDPLLSWNQPSRVPECLVSSLEYFDWRQYGGREEEKQVARYILGNSGRLRFVTFYPNSENPVKKLQMLTELSMSPRRSSVCQLEFL